MLERILEPEVMDTEAEAMDYDAMDFQAVNLAFAQRACQLGPTKATVLDAGTGTARIPILLAQLRPAWQITAIDFARSMLVIAKENVVAAGCETQICLEFVDAKRLPYANGSFDGVIANSLCHHLPRPLDFLREVKRVLKPHGFLLIRDLIRPESPEKLAALVTAISSDYNGQQRKLFADSLQASLTMAEVEAYLQHLGWVHDDGTHLGLRLYQSSDRHWTIEKAFQNRTEGGS
ncbi:class I SAM-dependent methyltransferase [Synechocystis sp. PCC 7339]|uniref:class I SAM-dependent methyltransferase n=1 Tax=unclassified Synechocystis TaxID=2640012 RepID=UPI001BB06DBF|nr:MULTISPECIES: class I SAM-dependent methyltransferase [unclassified Synechocystis]QUS59403.1 class I SAM-dependent methyltransferase [Synechocystis sp. PCC 7338]UAJ71586.1 class I SAM-dependent methyltransferase [Synechocystis sp. PCC 7339]